MFESGGRQINACYLISFKVNLEGEMLFERVNKNNNYLSQISSTGLSTVTTTCRELWYFVVLHARYAMRYAIWLWNNSAGYGTYPTLSLTWTAQRVEISHSPLPCEHEAWNRILVEVAQQSTGNKCKQHTLLRKRCMFTLYMIIKRWWVRRQEILPTHTITCVV